MCHINVSSYILPNALNSVQTFYDHLNLFQEAMPLCVDNDTSISNLVLIEITTVDLHSFKRITGILQMVPSDAGF